MLFAPSGRPIASTLGYFDKAGKQLKKVAADGGSPQLICRANGGDGSWGSRDVIVFDDHPNDAHAIYQVSASGGEPTLATSPDTSLGEIIAGTPSFLSDGRHFVYIALPRVWGGYDDEITLKIGDIEGVDNRVLGVANSQGICTPNDQVLYLQQGALFMRQVNLKSLAFEGEPIAVRESKDAVLISNDALNFCAGMSKNDILVLQKSRLAPSQLVWVDRSGRELDTLGPTVYYSEISLSPDNEKVAYSFRESPASEFKIGVFYTETGVASRLTSNSGAEYFPIWSSDGKSVAYCGYGVSDVAAIRYCRLDDPVPKTAIESGLSDFIPLSWSASNKLWWCEYLHDESSDVRRRVLVRQMEDPDRVEEKCSLHTPVRARGVIGDGRYLLYQLDSNEGRIFVCDMQQPARRWCLSHTGAQARFCPATEELFFFEGNDFVAVQLDLREGFRYSAPKLLFTREYIRDPLATVWGYDVSNDGQRFLFVTPYDEKGSSAGDIEVILNWSAELEYAR